MNGGATVVREIVICKSAHDMLGHGEFSWGVCEIAG
jgi:hypothetical protein